MTNEALNLGNLGPDEDRIVYVREVGRDEIPAQALEAGAPEKLYAIHDAQGARLALTDDRRLAFKLAREHDKTPLSVH